MVLSPNTSMSSCNVLISLWGDSNITIGRFWSLMEFRERRRFARRFGRNPRYVNSLIGKNASGTAAVIADGPGIVVTDAPALIASITNSAPGSLTRGMPASDTSATSAVSRICMIFGRRYLWFCSL